VKKEKDDLGKSMKVIEKDIKKHLSNIKPAKIQTDMKKLVESIENNSLIPRNEAEENSMKELLEKTDQFESVKTNFDRLQADFETKSTEMEGLTSQLTRSKSDCNSAVEKLRKSESDLGQIKEKNAQLSDELLNQSRKITILENTVPSSTGTTANGNNSNKSKEIEDLENKVKELTKKLCESEKASKPKKSVKFNADPVTEPPVDKLKELESALEKAYLERNEILKSCKEEVEFHRTIASELETSILEDFEWKLHEIEKDYNSRLKHAREDIDEQIKEATSAIMMEKNEEIQKMRIQVCFIY
jgi:predicted  nucleic acid-binding Zn-ribbon protein